MDIAPSLEELSQNAAEKYKGIYESEPHWIVAAPGRVNLIGEHTDYNEGFVLPMAIDRYVVIAAGPQSSGGENDFTLHSELVNKVQQFTLAESVPADLPPWCIYSYGVLDLLRKRGIQVGPLQLSIQSSVPLGGGLSSSAALEVATATLVEAVTGSALDGRDKAKLCQQAENEYAGVPCGIMDQFSSALCQADQAMRLDCRSLELTPVPLTDPDVTVLITNSNVTHNLASSEYPVRRASCEAAAAKLGVDALRDVTLETLQAAKSMLDNVEYRRAKHVIGENARVLEFSEAASNGDWPTAGKLMVQSHNSLRDDYEVSCPEIDTLVDLATGIGLEGGVYGSRITGGGFGGCTVTLAKTAAVETIAEQILADYQTATGKQANCFTSRPAQGAHVVRAS